jgi:GT2 family glycosyltransferase
VLNFNGRRWLEPCLSALKAQAGAPDFEVVLIDNGSTDDSVPIVAKNFPEVRIVETGRNLGFAGGNNAGARAARGSLLAFLNNDTIPAPEWLARLHAALGGGGDRALVTSRLVDLTRPDIVDSAGDGYLRAGGAYKHGHGESLAKHLEAREVFGACGGAFMIRRDVFESLGGFDEDFFMVYEDVDLSYRARLAGYRCWYAPDALVRHAGSGTLGTTSAQAVYYGQRNLEWTWLKNTPGGLLLRTLAAHAIYSIAGVAHYIGRGRGAAAVRGKIAALLSLPRILRKRRIVQRTRRVDTRAVEALMERNWVAVKRREKSAR